MRPSVSKFITSFVPGIKPGCLNGAAIHPARYRNCSAGAAAKRLLEALLEAPAGLEVVLKAPAELDYPPRSSQQWRSPVATFDIPPHGRSPPLPTRRSRCDRRRSDRPRMVRGRGLLRISRHGVQHEVHGWPPRRGRIGRCGKSVHRVQLAGLATGGRTVSPIIAPLTRHKGGRKLDVVRVVCRSVGRLRRTMQDENERELKLVKYVQIGGHGALLR